MTTQVEQCAIWNMSDDLKAKFSHATKEYLVDNSPRAGGAYIVSLALVNSDLIHMTDAEKARLTSWLVGQRLKGNRQPTITKQVIDWTRNGTPLAVQERAYRLLRLIAQKSTSVGASVRLSNGDPEALAWTESTVPEEVDYLHRFLDDRGFLNSRHSLGGNSSSTVTMDGYSVIAEESLAVDSKQAFVAMWFNDTLAQAYEEGLAAGIREAGYDPLRIDRKEHVNRIEDEIIAEIRRSRFVVADFTQGEDGARGGVYYEAGFAHGLGLPVVFTCHKDSLETLHFDTSHFSHIVWDEPEDLREQLRNRIRAVIGQGPGDTGVA